MGRSWSSSAFVCSPKDEVEETSVGRFFSCGFGVKERFWNRQQNTEKSIEVKSEIFLLPDGILEMCLDRVACESLDNARLVCKKWSSLITIAKVLQKKKEYRYQNLWFFVFGTCL
ncbi:putative F-box domain-containing protein [Medicago truncatula]|uniref:Putative F-box domain-containing protein n=1 Tax=Medicago truncatula TaxID=3880 RepID=A0A396K014_MEDTR|nr:putative F-box domain-containing protein [Medicago truncatula]